MRKPLILLLVTPLFLVSACTVTGNTPTSRTTAREAGLSDRQYSTIYDAFSTYDINHDGYIDQIEFQRFQQDPEIIRLRDEIQQSSQSTPLLFEEIDENDDNVITLEEMTRIIQPHLPLNDTK
jgi:hypothetical protein